MLKCKMQGISENTQPIVPVSACWLLSYHQQVDLWPFDLQSGVRYTCVVGYPCANFKLPELLRSRVRPDIRDRETDGRQTSDIR